ncbi:WxL domain-containing protein [Apilactobacillus timberlakei]|uniref:WxL domain-containing protein n=1 Tax=Apilactobacillus timberlakei TaxID=2008380 RepID=UPI00112AD968|nr:WxL domain-containing protein [Apilactobacillus timberlakei]TPR19419.1 WxL domain-containing protein [Apilactobacillus timberlakei]TPR20797.1 WxL domain-containing protein [Apilactobacillus timberlakei]
MKKLLLCTAALTMFAGSALALNGSNVKADNGSSTTTQTNTSSDGPKANTSKSNMDNNGNKIQTNTYFEVDNSKNSTPPADPINPGSELEDPTGHGVLQTDAKGDLTIDAVPNLLNFGKITDKLEGNNINDNLKFGNEDENGNKNQYYYAQVSDFRNTHSGWNLSAKMSDMTNNQNISLKNAQITFKNNSVFGAYSNNNSSSTGVKTSNNIILSPSLNNVSMMNAQNGYGAGTWLDKFDEINLSANRSDAGKYNGTITWNLTEGPGNDPGNINNSVNTSTKQTNNQQQTSGQ